MTSGGGSRPPPPSFESSLMPIMLNHRLRGDDVPKARRNVVSKFAPDIPRPKADADVPMMGQRKRKKARRAKLLPNPQV